MNQQHGAQALTILWTEPVNSTTPPAWDGPSPFAAPEPEPAPALGGLAGAWETWAALQGESSDIGPTPEASKEQANESVAFSDGTDYAAQHSFAGQPTFDEKQNDAAYNEAAAPSVKEPANDVFAPPSSFASEPVSPSAYEQAPAQPLAQPEHQFGQSAPAQQSSFQPGPEAPMSPAEAAPGASTGSHVFTGAQPPEQPAPESFAPPAQPYDVSPVAPSELPANEGLAAPEVSALPAPGDEPSVNLSKGSDDAYADVDAAPTSLSGPQSGSSNDDIPEDALTIGRSRSNGIVLDDMLVSRQHVMITADDEGLLLRDLGSRNGTYVNGQRVEQTHLHEGDRIGIGQSTFEVRDGWLVSV